MGSQPAVPGPHQPLSFTARIRLQVEHPTGSSSTGATLGVAADGSLLLEKVKRLLKHGLGQTQLRLFLQKLLQQSGWIVVVLEQAFQNPADSQFQVEKLRWGLLEVLLDIGQTGARRLAAGKHDNVDTESIKVDLIVRFKRQFLGLPKSPN